MKVRVNFHNYRARQLGSADILMIDDWLDVLEASNQRGTECGSDSFVQIDPIVPMEQGGRNIKANIEALCRDCHSVKSRQESTLRHYIQAQKGT